MALSLPYFQGGSKLIKQCHQFFILCSISKLVEWPFYMAIKDCWINKQVDDDVQIDNVGFAGWKT